MDPIIKFKPFKKSSKRYRYTLFKPRRVGIILTGVFPGLDEELIESLMIGRYEMDDLRKIHTIGEDEEGFEYINRFAKKYDLEVMSIPIEGEDPDNEYLYTERTPDIIDFVDSVLIIHGNKEGRTAAWYALSCGQRWKAETCFFVNFEGKYEFEGREKEVYELVKKPSQFPFNEKIEFMEQSFFELNDEARPKFMKYLAKGEKMSFEEIMLNLTRVYLYHPDKSYYETNAYIADRMMDSMFWYYKPEYYDEDELIIDNKRVEKYLQTEINPDFRSATNESEDLSELHYHPWIWWEVMMELWDLDGYDEDIYAALAYSFWISLNHYRGIRV